MKNQYLFLKNIEDVKVDLNFKWWTPLLKFDELSNEHTFGAPRANLKFQANLKKFAYNRPEKIPKIEKKIVDNRPGKNRFSKFLKKREDDVIEQIWCTISQ